MKSTRFSLLTVRQLVGTPRPGLLLLALVLASVLWFGLAMVLGACSPSPGPGVVPRSTDMPTPGQVSTLPTEDWATHNEAAVLGDWDGALWYTQAGGAHIQRSSVYYEDGSYSYDHYSDCPDSECWAFSYISCTVPVTVGVMDAWVRFQQLPGNGVLDYDFLAAFETEVVNPPLAGEAWRITLDSATNNSQLICGNCAPNQGWMLTGVVTDTWQHYRVEWDLPVNSTHGSIKAWVDGVLYLDETNLDTDVGGVYHPIDTIGAGVKDWHYIWGDEISVYIDNVQINGCDEPIPAPTPTPAPCGGTYGHAATLNVAADCSSLIRFEGLLASIPPTATITYAGLRIYGVSMEQTGQWIYITPLVPQWGEATANWCNRLVYTQWTGAGATDIPLDREPGYVAVFEAKLGWIQVDLPPGLVTTWLSDVVNPGVILHNVAMAGKFAVASREWYNPSQSYGPKLVINWQ